MAASRLKLKRTILKEQRVALLQAILGGYLYQGLYIAHWHLKDS